MAEPVRIDDYRPEPTILPKGGGGGTYDDMDIVDAKISASEARTDTKFAELMGELRLIAARLEHLENSTSGVKATIVVTAVGVLAITGGIFAYGTSMFATGMDAQAIAERAAIAVEDRSASQLEAANARYDELNQQVGAIVEMLTAQQSGSTPQLDFDAPPEGDGSTTAPSPMPFRE